MDAAALQAAVQERQEQIDAPTQALQQLPTGADHALPVLAVAIWARTPLVMQGAQVVTATMPNDAISAARQLFATLRALDAQGVAQIWVETPPATPDWDGVRDRLQRAAH